MGDMSALLIIASAFSVFSQYIDTNHRNQAQAIKDRIKSLDFSDADRNPGFKKVKIKWDDFLAHECLRATGHIKALFAYLIYIVLLVTSFKAYMLYNDLLAYELEKHYTWATLISGVILLTISIMIGFRLKAMNKERIAREDDAVGIEDLHDAVSSALKSVK